MSIDNLSADSISSFVPTSEQLITLTIGQLQDLIKEAVRDAIKPIQEEVEQLQGVVASQQKELRDLRDKVASLESIQEQDTTRLALDIAHDRQRIARLERPEKEPQPLQKDRADILRAILAANGGKMLAKDARKKMHLRKDLFSQLLKTCDFVTLKPYHADKRQKIIILKSELV